MVYEAIRLSGWLNLCSRMERLFDIKAASHPCRQTRLSLPRTAVCTMSAGSGHGQNKVIFMKPGQNSYNDDICRIGLLYAKHHVSLRPHCSVERYSIFCHFYVVFRTWLACM